MVYDPAFDDATTDEDEKTGEKKGEPVEETEAPMNPGKPALRELKVFQRWVVQRYAEFIPWDKYEPALEAKARKEAELEIQARRETGAG